MADPVVIHKLGLRDYLGWIFRGHLGVITLVAVLSFVSALLEAATLASIAGLVAALALEGDKVLQVTLPVIRRQVSLAPPELLVISTTAVLGRAAMQTLVAVVDSRAVGAWEARRRAALFERFIDASWALQSMEQVGRLQTFMSENISQGSRALHSFAAGVVAVCNFTILLTAALFIDVKAGLAMLGVAVMLFLATRPVSSVTRRHTTERARLNLGLSSSVNEAVELAREVRVFNVRGAFIDGVERLIGKVRRERSFVALTTALVQIIYQNLAGLAIIAGLGALYWLDASDIAKHAMVALLLIRALSYGQSLQSVYHHISEGMPYVEQLELAEHTFAQAREPEGERDIDRIERIDFRNLSFAYGEEHAALSNVSFEVKRGEAIGIVGPSGSGKSTLVQLLLRLRWATGGEYLVNGESATSLSRSRWFRLVSYVPQEPRLLTASVADNIAFHREGITQVDIERASRLAGLHEEIARLPAGYQTLVGPRGEGFSGGQRQRMCIARALVGKPEVVIFDEPTSSLDVHAEAVVQEALARIKGQATIFIVAHRLSTLRVCDRVMVFRSGRLEAFAPIAELSERDKYFAEALKLAQVQA